jgi:AmiR/NasT family two-component response regulator
MDLEMRRPHHCASHEESRGLEANRAIIARAVQLVMAEHGISEMSAYTVLVHASADSHTSVRETAARLLASLR